MRWPLVGRPLFVSVNLTLRQLADPGFLDCVTDTLERTGLPPRRLCLEITESIIAEQNRDCAEILSRLRKRGVSVAIDHFGVGCSSLSYLKHLPINTLKIDSTFIHELPESPRDRVLVGAIISLGRSLGIRVIAKGVETEAQAECLRACGCTLIQGALKSPPLAEWDFSDYLRGEFR